MLKIFKETHREERLKPQTKTQLRTFYVNFLFKKLGIAKSSQVCQIFLYKTFFIY